jgi:hypothetical protein
MFLHAFNTWVVANLLHPFLIFGLERMNGHSGLIFCNNIFSDFFLAYLLSFFSSLPCLLGAWLIVEKIVLSDFSPLARFFIWLVSSSVLVLAEVIFMTGNISSVFNLEMFSAAMPGILVVSAAIIIRYKQFQNLIHSFQKNKHENDLV